MKYILRPAWGITPALLLVLICGIARPANASIVYVNKNAPGAVHDGTSWATAFTAVQPAIDSAKSGDEVWVAQGAYRQSLNLASGVALVGGFTGTETDRSQRNWKAHACIIDGQGALAGVTMQDGSALDGVTVRHCETGASLTASSTIANCIFRGYETGIYVRSGSAIVTGSTICGSNSTGIEVDGSSKATVSNCTITNNGTGVNVDTGTIAITNCTISGNRLGVLIWAPASTPSAIANTIVAFNAVGIFKDGAASSISLTHNDVYANPSGNYAGINDPTGVNGNLRVDPILSNVYRDIHLQPTSPCRDKGLDSVAKSSWTDIDGQPRFIGAHVDIGSDESDGTSWTVQPRRWYVSTLGNDQNDGSTWATAKATVTDAVDSAESLDEVWVAGGTYSGTVDLLANVSLLGGFSGSETISSQRDWVKNAAVLSPDGSDIAVLSLQGAVIDGFVIHGSDVGIETGGGTTVLNNCSVNDCSSGIQVWSGILSVSRCVCSSNQYGIEIWRGTNVKVSDSTFTGNYFSAIVMDGTVKVERCTIGSSQRGVEMDQLGDLTLRDSALCNNGDGVFVQGTAAINNCTACDNNCAVNLYAGKASISNCILAFNGTGVSRPTTGYFAVLSHNDVYGNSTANYSGVINATGIRGNISADPYFTDRKGGDISLGRSSPCIDAGDDLALTAGETDLSGKPRSAGLHVDIGAIEGKSELPWSVPLGTTVQGGVTVAENVAYVAGSDGKLYARSTEDGSAVAGFPVDINAAVGATVKLPSRPAVYYGRTGKAIYLTTDRGDVVRVLPDGTVAWHVRPLTGQTVSTPAVTPDGNVFVNLSTGSGPFNNYVFKLDEATGTPLSLSPFVGYTTADNIGDFSPAANNRYLYVNSGWGSKSGLTLLNQDNLAVRSSFASGEQCLSPLLLGSDFLLASKGGKAWKMNAVTLAPDLGFGHFGVADLGTQITAAPFSDAAGNVYIGTVDGKILKWAPGSGAFQPFYTATGKIAGLTIDRTAGLLGFGTSAGSFVQVPLGDPASATSVTPGGPISTGTVYESLTDRFIVVTDTGVLSGYPAIR